MYRFTINIIYLVRIYLFQSGISHFLPSPYNVGIALWNGLLSNLIMDAGISLFRIMIGMGISLLIAFPLGLALGMSQGLEAFIEPIIAFIRYIPPSAFIPVVIIWAGIGEAQKIIILTLGIAPYLTLVVANLVLHTRSKLVDVALTLGATQYQILRNVIIPGILPDCWNVLRIAFGSAWTLVIIAEIVGSDSGLGYLMVESGRFLRTDILFSAIISIGILGLLTDYFFKLMYPVLFPWMKKQHA